MHVRIFLSMSRCIPLKGVSSFLPRLATLCLFSGFNATRALPETKLTVESRSEECEEVGKCVGGTCVGHSAHCARSASRREADAAARGEWRAAGTAGGGGGGRVAQEPPARNRVGEHVLRGGGGGGPTT